MTENTQALTHLYHPSGPKVDIPLSLMEALTIDARILIRSVDALLEAGFTVNLPGVGDGETLEDIGFIVRKSKVNEDGTETPVIDLYPVNGNFRLIGHYLNNADMVAEFEAAVGLRLSALPLYEGDNSIERGKNPKLDKYVVPLPKPAKLVFKQNPKYEGENDKKHPKRLFVRWHELRPLVEEPMTLERAKNMVTPGKLRYDDLTLEQLQTIINSGDKVKLESRQAAQLLYDSKKESQ
jgi:hypothetical protein